MQHTGKTKLEKDQYDTYAHFRAAVLNNGYDWAGSYGDQCWDGVQLLYGQYGETLYTGPDSSAYECWTVSADKNTNAHFGKITDKTKIKRGDDVVFGNSWYPPYGHIGYADQDYNSGNMQILGQNQGGTPYVQGGAFFSLTNMPSSYIIGAFRPVDWESAPEPEPEKKKARRKFPWPVAWRHWDYL